MGAPLSAHLLLQPLLTSPSHLTKVITQDDGRDCPQKRFCDKRAQTRISYRCSVLGSLSQWCTYICQIYLFIWWKNILNLKALVLWIFLQHLKHVSTMLVILIKEDTFKKKMCKQYLWLFSPLSVLSKDSHGGVPMHWRATWDQNYMTQHIVK